MGDVISYPSMSETGRDAAACAIAFLTHLPEACRQILREIQTRPLIAHMLFIYANPSALSDEFQSRWQNIKLGLSTGSPETFFKNLFLNFPF